jgi:hypothetical protein
MVIFLWNDEESKHNYHFPNWKSMAKKEFGGIGAPDHMNLCSMHLGFGDIKTLIRSFGEKLLMPSIRQVSIIYSATMTGRPPLLERGDVECQSS